MTNQKRQATVFLSTFGIEIGQEFLSLNADQKAAINAEAGAAYLRKHGKPMPIDSGSYIGKRYALIQQRAA